ncbi:MAG: c-type cytochrome [Gammaproteobacteria bacterium]|nr:c-type cytochrome [Gammaproteobacteria bacterium]
MKKISFFLFILSLSSLVIAQPKHDDIINACSACHGLDGNGISEGIPNLWQQPEAYLKAQIEAFRDYTRINPSMDAVSHELPDADILYAAQYYSKQPDSSSRSKEQPQLQWRGDKWPGDMMLGEKIAYTGKISDKIQACVACHGPSGIGVAPFFPRLKGQDKTYLIKQLNAWKTADRPPGVMGVMVSIAVSLTDEEINAVADYFANQGEKK